MSIPSNTGHIATPREILDDLNGERGLQLTLETTGSGVVLKFKANERTLRLEDLRGFLKCDGAPVSIEALCEPVDYTADWEASEKLSR